MKRWPSVLRYLWLPLLLGLGAIGVVVGGMVDLKAASEAGRPMASLDEFKSVLKVPMPVFFGGLAAGYLALFLLISGGCASVFRLVVHGEDRKGLFQLRFDGPALRVFFSFIILALINIAVFGAALLLAAAVTGKAPLAGFGAIMEFFAAAAKAEPGDQLPQELVAGILTEARPLMMAWFYSLIPMLYLGVKLAPFPAASAAEDRLLLLGTFRMTFGHWWSMFFCFLLTSVALLLLSIVVEIPYQIISGLGGALAKQGAAAGAIGGIIVIVATIAYLFYQIFVVAVQLALNAVIYRRLAYGD